MGQCDLWMESSPTASHLRVIDAADHAAAADEDDVVVKTLSIDLIICCCRTQRYMSRTEVAIPVFVEEVTEWCSHSVDQETTIADHSGRVGEGTKVGRR